MPLIVPDESPCPFCEYLMGERPYTILDRNDGAPADVGL